MWAIIWDWENRAFYFKQTKIGTFYAYKNLKNKIESPTLAPCCVESGARAFVNANKNIKLVTTNPYNVVNIYDDVLIDVELRSSEWIGLSDCHVTLSDFPWDGHYNK